METRAILEGDEKLELSFIELVIAASECSEDESEIYDLIDGALTGDRIDLVPTDLPI